MKTVGNKNKNSEKIKKHPREDSAKTKINPASTYILDDMNKSPNIVDKKVTDMFMDSQK